MNPTNSDVMFKVFSFQHIGFELDYFEAAYALLDVLILVYNKMYDNRCLNETMFKHLEFIDKCVMDIIIDPITVEISDIADDVMAEEFGNLKNMLSFEDIVTHPSMETSFNRVFQKGL